MHTHTHKRTPSTTSPAPSLLRQLNESPINHRSINTLSALKTGYTLIKHTEPQNPSDRRRVRTKWGKQRCKYRFHNKYNSNYLHINNALVTKLEVVKLKF